MNHLISYNEHSDFLFKEKGGLLFGHNDQSMTDDELFEMANLWGESTGLDNVVIWVGSTERTKHGPRIKVSNFPDNMNNGDDVFSITIPDLEIKGDVNKKHITRKKLEKIFKFIEMNKDIIIDISENKIDTVSFIQRMKKLEN